MNCNSSKGKCFDEFTKKKLLILAKIKKNWIFIYFSAMHPLKGKINIYFFCFTKKSCQETLGFAHTGMKYPFRKKSTSFKIYDHFNV